MLVKWFCLWIICTWKSAKFSNKMHNAGSDHFHSKLFRIVQLAVNRSQNAEFKRKHWNATPFQEATLILPSLHMCWFLKYTNETLRSYPSCCNVLDTFIKPSLLWAINIVLEAFTVKTDLRPNGIYSSSLSQMTGNNDSLISDTRLLFFHIKKIKPLFQSSKIK